MFEQIAILVLGAGAIFGAGNVVFRRNPAICAVFLVLTFLCGLLALLASIAAASGAVWLRGWLAPYFVLPATVTTIVVKLVSLLLTITIATIVYVVLPNGHVATRRTLGIAVWVGLALELAKAAYLLIWPHLGFRNIYGPFFVSVTLLMGGYMAALILLAGGEIAARGRTE